jgi:hypothetical protein
MQHVLMSLLSPPIPPLADAQYHVAGPERVEGVFWQQPNVIAGQLHCYECLASTVTIAPLLQLSSAQSILLARAEVLTHPEFGSESYWQIRAR